MVKTLYSLRERAAHEDTPYDTSVLHDAWAETIIKVVESNTPVDDGDFPSKFARDNLIKHGYLAKIVLNGEQAGTVATYKGGYLYCQLVDVYPSVRAAIAFRKTQPNFLNDLWKSQHPQSEEADARPCSSN